MRVVHRKKKKLPQSNCTNLTDLVRQIIIPSGMDTVVGITVAVGVTLGWGTMGRILAMARVSAVLRTGCTGADCLA